MPDWKRILIHHSAGPDTDGLDAAGIRKYHVEVRGWQDVGYHWLCEKVDGKYRTVPGRSLGKAGAHCPGQNEIAIGICLVGNFEHEPPHKEQVDAVAELCAAMCVRFGFSPDEIYPHRDFRQTVCPGLVPIDEIREHAGYVIFEG